MNSYSRKNEIRNTIFTMHLATLIIAEKSLKIMVWTFVKKTQKYRWRELTKWKIVNT